MCAVRTVVVTEQCLALSLPVNCVTEGRWLSLGHGTQPSWVGGILALLAHCLAEVRDLATFLSGEFRRQNAGEPVDVPAASTCCRIAALNGGGWTSVHSTPDVSQPSPLEVLDVLARLHIAGNRPSQALAAIAGGCRLCPSTDVRSRARWEFLRGLTYRLALGSLERGVVGHSCVALMTPACRVGDHVQPLVVLRHASQVTPSIPDPIVIPDAAIGPKGGGGAVGLTGTLELHPLLYVRVPVMASESYPEFEYEISVLQALGVVSRIDAESSRRGPKKTGRQHERMMSVAGFLRERIASFNWQVPRPAGFDEVRTGPPIATLAARAFHDAYQGWRVGGNDVLVCDSLIHLADSYLDALFVPVALFTTPLAACARSLGISPNLSDLIDPLVVAIENSFKSFLVYACSTWVVGPRTSASADWSVASCLAAVDRGAKVAF